MRGVFALAVPGLAVVLCVTWLTERGAAAPEPTVQVAITTSELVVGENRLAFGLLKRNTLVDAAKVVVRIYDVGDREPRLTAETPAAFHRLEVVARGHHVHVHPDGTRHLHDAATDVQGVYVSRVVFTRPGAWGLEIVARLGDEVDVARLTVDVLGAARAPAPGAPAPRSRNATAADVSDLRQIDSSEPPDPRLHQIRIADAIAQGKPQVIVFATPRYCVSRLCGPVVDVVRTLIPDYGDHVAFVHQEIWERGPALRVAPTVEEWNLQTEPWIFVVDGQGTIRARFEGLTTRNELEAVLRSMLRRVSDGRGSTEEDGGSRPGR